MAETPDPVTTELEAMRNRPARDVWVMLGVAKRDNERALRTLEAIRGEAARWKRAPANSCASPARCAEKLEQIIGEKLLSERGPGDD
jgi:hypothetical protein